MVLRSNVVRRALDSENTPPTINKTRSSRSRTALDPNRKRRTRTIDAASAIHAPRHLVEQAKRKEARKSKPATNNPIKVQTTTASSSRDVEMQDVRSMLSMKFPLQLARPEYKAVSQKSIGATSPELANVPVEYSREYLEEKGPQMLATVSAVQATYSRQHLLSELPIEMGDVNDEPPSHVLAIHNAGPPNDHPRQVTLFPVHAVLLAAYCTNLPPFKDTRRRETTSSDGPIMVPTVPLNVPSPETFQHLIVYLYTKRTAVLLNSLLPLPIPERLEENQRQQIQPFATLIGRTFSTELIVAKIFLLRGFWHNVIALGIFDEGVWDTIDLAWDILITALAVSHGKPHLMIHSIPTPA